MKTTTLNPTPDAARTLFEMLDQIHLVAIHPDRKNAVPIARDFATDVDAAINWAITQNAKGWNIYWTVNRVLDGLHKKPKKEQIIAARFAHVDIDPPKNDPTAFDKGAAAYDLVMLDTAPSFIIDSGNGLQAFWRLAPVRDRSNEEGATLKASNISMLEIKAALRIANEDNAGGETADLVRAAARLLGFRRVGGDLQARLAAGLEMI